MPKLIMHVGVDDTDSTKGGCTTYVIAVLVEKLSRLGAKFLDYPVLLRLNPNVPWKTRGNGALGFRIECEENLVAAAKETVVETVEELSDLGSKGTDPGIVFVCRAQIPEKAAVFANKAITKIVNLKEAKGLVAEIGGEALGYNTCRGIIGALAAIGKKFDGDYTYELIAYRTPKNWGLKRLVEKSSIFEMDRLTRPLTFNNVDLEKQRVIITPRGPDPILFGIRGESPENVKKAFELIKPLEPVERWVIFRTNQGTDEHIVRVSALRELGQYTNVAAKGFVSSKPRNVPLRHVVFSVKDESGEVECIAFEPTGNLRRVASKLIVGDKVEVYGAVRKRPKTVLLTVNLEKINVLSLEPDIRFQNPVCLKCCKRLESMGKGQGFRCKKCGMMFDCIEKVRVVESRELKTGLHVTSIRSQRHLTKPLSRYGLEKKGLDLQPLITEWHS